MSLWNRDYTEASQAALASLYDTCSTSPDTIKRFAALIATTDLDQYISKNQRRLQLFVNKSVGIILLVYAFVIHLLYGHTYTITSIYQSILEKIGSQSDSIYH